MLLEVIQGNDKMDSTSHKGHYEKDYSNIMVTDVRALKIGVPKEFFMEGLDAEIASSIKASMKKFEAMGAEVEEISLPIANEGLAAYYIISSDKPV